MAPIATDDSRQSPPVLATSKEPRVPSSKGGNGTVGDQALMDAIILIVACWVLIFFLALSLRSHNI